MRTPKYRVYIKHWGNSENDSIEYPKEGELHVYIGNWERGGYKEAIFQQFTGLLDKNGNPIYEGDILLCRGYDDWSDEEGHHYTLTVEWKQRDNGDIAESYGYLYIPKDRKIIGNIFENENK